MSYGERPVMLPRALARGNASGTACELYFLLSTVYFRFSLMSQQLLVLLLLCVVDQLDVMVGDLLHFVEPALFVVLRNRRVLQELLEPIVGIAADLAHGVAAFLGQLV